MKQFIFVTGLIITLLLAGCTGEAKPATSDTAIQELESSALSQLESSGEEEESSVSSQEDGQSRQDTKRVGQEFYGYVDIPEYWMNFVDVDGAGTSIQFSDPSGTSIITLNADHNPQQDPRVVLSAVAQSMESEGAQEITGAEVSLNGIDAVQVYGYYPADNTILVAWAFKSEDGYMHFVSAEGRADTVMEVVSYLESSYSLES